jgi:hypothetical protein
VSVFLQRLSNAALFGSLSRKRDKLERGMKRTGTIGYQGFSFRCKNIGCGLGSFSTHDSHFLTEHYPNCPDGTVLHCLGGKRIWQIPFVGMKRI